MTVDEAGDQDLPRDIQDLGGGPDPRPEAGTHGGDPLPGDGDIPVEDLPGIDVDDPAAREQEIRGGLAERHPEEASPLGEWERQAGHQRVARRLTRGRRPG